MAPLTFDCHHLAGSVFLKLHSTDIKDNIFTIKRIKLVHLLADSHCACKRLLGRSNRQQDTGLGVTFALRQSGLCEILIAETTWSCGIRAI